MNNYKKIFKELLKILEEKKHIYEDLNLSQSSYHLHNLSLYQKLSALYWYVNDYAKENAYEVQNVDNRQYYNLVHRNKLIELGYLNLRQASYYSSLKELKEEKNYIETRDLFKRNKSLIKRRKND